MIQGVFQVPVPTLTFGGSISADLKDSGGDPASIIRVTDSWAVELQWELTGTGVPYVGGTWYVHLNVEDMGGLDNFRYPLQALAVPLVPDGDGKYATTITVPSGFLHTEKGGRTYRLTASLSYETAGPNGKTGEFGGAVDLGTIEAI